jgi:hypothetical protein
VHVIKITVSFGVSLVHVNYFILHRCTSRVQVSNLKGIPCLSLKLLYIN